MLVSKIRPAVVLIYRLCQGHYQQYSNTSQLVSGSSGHYASSQYEDIKVDRSAVLISSSVFHSRNWLLISNK